MNIANNHLMGSLSESENSTKLTNIAYRYELLDAKSEKQISDRMHRSAQRILWALAESETISDLQELVLAAEESDKKQGSSNTRSRSKTNLHGLIDEIDVLHAFPSPANRLRLDRCLRKLKAQLSHFNPPPSLIMSFIHENRLHLSRKPSTLASKRISIARKTYLRERNEMVKANVRLVFKIAAKYRHLGLSYDDLVQEGNLGLIKAIEYFDASKGYRFSTYAYRIISQFIHSGIEKQGELVRKPFLMLREKQRVDQTLSRLEQNLGRAVSAKEVAERVKAVPEFAQAILGRNSAVSADNWEQTNHFPHEVDLTDTKLSDGMTTPLKTESLFKCIAELPQREQNMLIMRFGIGLKKDYTLEEISQQYGLSRERVRQLINASVAEIKDRIFGENSVG